MNKRPLRYLVFVAFFVVVISVPLLAEAAANIISFPSGNIPVNEYISRLYTFSLAIGGILAVAMITIGGVMYSISGAVDRQAEGKSMILSAIFGLVLLLGSYLLLKTINPELVILRQPGAGFISSKVGDVNAAATKCNAANSIGECSTKDADATNDVPFYNAGTDSCNCYLAPPQVCDFTSQKAKQCERRVPVPYPGSDVTIQIPACATTGFFESGILSFFNIPGVNHSCENDFPTIPTSPYTLTPGSMYWQYLYYPANGKPLVDAQCVVYALRKATSGSSTIRTPIQGLKPC